MLRNDGECVELSFSDIWDDVESPTVVESWMVSLCQDERIMHFTAKGSTVEAAVNRGDQVKGVVHSLYTSPLSTFGFYSQGVVQMKGASPERSYFGSSDSLSRIYTLGGSGAVDVARPTAAEASDVTILLNSADSEDFHGGFQEVLFGSFSALDTWSSGWSALEEVTPVPLADWNREWKISPNNRNFPSSSLPPGDISNLDNGDDLESIMTGIYANSVGCLCTYPGAVREGEQVGQIATTIRQDDYHGYNDTYNYFDPDNFIGLSAMLYSGDEYLLNQARIVIERSGSFIKPENGQLPHHFEGTEPYYLALSGETQTGPNTFWVKTALQYAFVSGNMEWLENYMPVLRNASNFVFDLVDPEKHLIYAPGSLMIDVFIRNNFTSDSNAMVVGFMRDFAEAERAVGNTERAIELERQAGEIAKAMNDLLWAPDDSGGDHFITQLNSDGTTRDFIDYDANLIAVAHSVPDESRSRKIMSRVDGGKCSASSGGGPQFVSELYYGEEDTTNGNQGDSWCSMARIGWFDAHSRKRFGTADDLEYFNSHILSTVQHDLIQNTWMHERYGCDGAQQENRTMYYFEYPSMLAMILREVRYGIELRMTDVTLNPFGTTDFEYHVGNINVKYSKVHVSLSLPGSGFRKYVVFGLPTNSEFEISISGGCFISPGRSNQRYDRAMTTDDNGVLIFTAPIGGSSCVVDAILVE